MKDTESTNLYRLALKRALSQGEPKLVQMHFDAEVLGRYREAPGISVIRTNTVGRVRKQGGWSLDFGIAPGERTLHASWGDVSHLPSSELEHWAAHALTLPSSRVFLSMRLSPGACIDDGEVREWQ